MKKVQKAYGKNGNGYIKKEINLLLVRLRIMKKVQDAYNGDDNRYLTEEMNPSTNKK